MTMLQQITPQRGRRTTKFTPANIQKIKDWVAQGTRREDIAKSLGVTVGSLQVTCSRLGISLRSRYNDPRRRVENRAFVSNSRVYAGHLQPGPKSRAKFQLVLQSHGMEQTTDLPFTTSDVGRLGVEASAQDLGLTDLMSQVLTQALKKGLIQEILGKK
jgi:hypothetical protein